MRLPFITLNVDFGYSGRFTLYKHQHSSDHTVIYLGFNIFNIEIDIVNPNIHWLKFKFKKYIPESDILWYDRFAMVRIDILNLQITMSYEIK